MSRAAPEISIVVIVYNMPRQAMNTLLSLSTAYQMDIDEASYEVIVIENRSENCLDVARVESMGPQFRYCLRDEPGVSPAAAINFGLSQARAPVIGLMIDGARMLTPGVLKYAREALAIFKSPLIVAPSYDLGSQLQQKSHETGYDEKEEMALLNSIGWPGPGTGYKLFSIAVLGEANDRGYFNPLMEGTCFFAKREHWEAISFVDERFQKRGGGALNLNTFRKLGLIPEIQLVILAGEGAFHQFHGGVTTGNDASIVDSEREFSEELDLFWPGGFNSVRRKPVYLGTVAPEALPFFISSNKRTLKRFGRLNKLGKKFWEDE